MKEVKLLESMKQFRKECQDQSKYYNTKVMIKSTVSILSRACYMSFYIRQNSQHDVSASLD